LAFRGGGNVTEGEAREVLLVRALEEEAPESLSPELRAQARLAAGDPTDLAGFVARRARFIVERLPAARRSLASVALPPVDLVLALLAIAFVLAAVSNGLSIGGRIHLLANPVTGLLLWNALVYLALTIAWLRRRSRKGAAARAPRSGWLHPLLAVIGRASVRVASLRGLRGSDPSETARVKLRFTTDLASACAPLLAERSRAVAHAGAIAFAAGALAGILLQGVAFAYRVEWGSTLVESPSARAAIVSLIFLPAKLALGANFPDTAALAEAATAEGAPAAVWFRVFAVTVLSLVVVPRLVLAALAQLRARGLASHVDLPLDDPAFQALAAEPSPADAGALERTVLSSFALGPAGLTVLASLQAALVANDIGATRAGGAMDALARKKAWFERWRGLVVRGFSAFPEEDRPALVAPDSHEFAVELARVREDENPFARELILLELAAFEAYWPLDASDVGWRDRLGLGPSLARSVHGEALESASLRMGLEADAGLSLRRALGRAMRALSGLWPKIALGAAAGTALGAVTAGLAAPLAAPIVGKAVGATGLLALKAGLAALGGHAVVAAGLGAAGGGVLVAGGGALLGAGTPAAGGGAQALTPAGALLSSAKIEVFLRHIAASRPDASSTVLGIVAELEASLARLRAELPAFRLDPARSTEEIREREKVIAILERVATRTASWARQDLVL
jgi:hypothetical protein